jgi:hypothetical protein
MTSYLTALALSAFVSGLYMAAAGSIELILRRRAA